MVVIMEQVTMTCSGKFPRETQQSGPWSSRWISSSESSLRRAPFRSGVVGMWQVGRPDSLHIPKGSILCVWPTCSYTFGTWVSSKLTTGWATLDWARDRGAQPRLGRNIQAKSAQVGWSDLPRTNAQVQVARVALGRDVASTVARNSAKGQRLGACRELKKEQ